MNWDDPEARLRYIEAHGSKAYNDGLKLHLKQSTVAKVGPYTIRPVSTKYGRLFAIAGPDGDTKMACYTLEQAKTYAEMQTKTNARRAYLVALESFIQAGYELDKKWAGLDSCGDFDLPNDGYPFKESFDDVLSGMTFWRLEVTKRILRLEEGR